MNKHRCCAKLTCKAHGKGHAGSCIRRRRRYGDDIVGSEEHKEDVQNVMSVLRNMVVAKDEEW